MKLYLSVEMPDELLAKWLQLVRDFDVQHAPRVHFIIGGEASEQTVTDKLEEVFAKIRPGFKHTMTIKEKP